MKFAHLSDCHLGGWRDKGLRRLGIESFRKAIETALQERAGFILIAGDLFDTALPPLDILKDVTSILVLLKEQDIPVYLIPGSHDYSASGKTMLDILEHAGLVENVMKLQDNTLTFTTDKTGTKITGYMGRKGGLEKNNYTTMNYASLEQEPGFKIFLFHTLLNQFKEVGFETLDCADLSILPKGFNYYAGGHPHFVRNATFQEYGTIAYPGPTFPNNFKELEELHHGGFYLAETTNNKLTLKHVSLKLKEVTTLFINADGKTPAQVEQEILTSLPHPEDNIITLRIEGTLKEGKPSDIDFRNINKHCEKAYALLKNTTKLVTQEYEQPAIHEPSETLEQDLIKQTLTNTFHNEEEIIYTLITALDKEKLEGEKTQDYETRIINEATKALP
ncbi:MAG TPA: DNA repair exonuclease [Candidatus Nanoarchaeia archaeon]|nr:DNA repair exonuclease [Candidatus Nanoarchaeia archaeon]